MKTSTHDHPNSDIGVDADPEAELDRQIQNLLDRGYPEAAGLTPTSFRARLEDLRPLLPGRSDGAGIPFVVVVSSTLVPTVTAVERFEVRGRAGWTDMADEIDGYRPIEGVDVPLGEVYLLLDVETGADTLNVRPNDALPVVVGRGRTPLTTDEGVALVTQFPELLKVRNAFQALGSRADNLRIPSFWVSKGAPRLGWCWAGNPHTWLGAASAAGRLPRA